jgi:DNA-binding XRE family transcriptional regulator
MIGEVIRRRRERRGLSQRDLARRVGTGAPHISKIENEVEVPSEEVLTRIAEELDLDPVELNLMAGRVPAQYVRALCANPQRAAIYLGAFVHGSKSDPGSGAGYQSQGRATGSLPPGSPPTGTLTSTPDGAPDVRGTIAGGRR